MNTHIRKQSPWGGWWLLVVTLGIYYFPWYSRVNTELAAVDGAGRPGWSQWWSQLIPIYGLVGMHKTAQRLNTALASNASSTRIGPFTFWFWAPLWFASHTRYFQRRQNALADVLAARSLGAVTGR